MKKTTALSAAALFFAGTMFAQDQASSRSLALQSDSMTGVLPRLVQIASYTGFFVKLKLVEVSEEQRQRLRRIDRDYSHLLLESSEAYWQAQSVLDGILSRKAADLAAITAAVDAKERIRARLELERIRYALDAIQVLDHSQHIEVLNNTSAVLNAKSGKESGQ